MITKAWLKSALVGCAGLIVASTQTLAADWPQFRGPDGQGHADSAKLPLHWSETQNVKWKTELPGQGWSSPVIFGNQIWMSTAQEAGRSLRALCVDLDSGKLLQNIELFQVDAPEFKHALNSYASPTPVIEEGRVYFSFGDYGFACVATDNGKILWKNRELRLEHENGPGSSPILYKNLLILNCDGTNVQYVAALDKGTGKVAWKTTRSQKIDKDPPMLKAYTTPLVIRVRGEDQLISPAAEYVYAYEPLRGKELWFVHYPGFSNVPRPVFGEGLLYIATGFGKPEMWAMLPGGKGNVTESNVAWKYLKQAPAKPSPIFIGKNLYMISDGGIATCLDGRTGKLHWQERIGGDYSASPISAGNQIYFCNQDGKTTVVEAGDTFKVLAENKLPDGFMASPAVAGEALVLRTKTAIYRIQE